MNISKKTMILWSTFLVAAWTTIIVLLFKFEGKLTIEQILSYKPNNVALTLFILFLIYVLKSVDFLVDSGIIFAAVGIMFPLPVAILINLCGQAIIITIPFFASRQFANGAVDKLLENHPKLKRIHEIHSGSPFLMSILLRAFCIPIAAGTLYTALMDFKYHKSLFGSLIGWFPAMICYTVIGMEIHDYSSPKFIIAVIVRILVIAASGVGYMLFDSKARKNNTD